MCIYENYRIKKKLKNSGPYLLLKLKNERVYLWDEGINKASERKNLLRE